MKDSQATIESREGNQFLVLQVNAQQLEIPLTENKPNSIKDVFNELIQELKNRDLKFEFIVKNENFYSQICKEYLLQLNSELASIREEIKGYKLDKAETVWLLVKK